MLPAVLVLLVHPAPAPAPLAPSTAVAQESPDLGDEWADALAAWRAAPEAERGPQPAAEFWPRFRDAAAEGEEWAGAWMLEHAGDAARAGDADAVAGDLAEEFRRAERDFWTKAAEYRDEEGVYRLDLATEDGLVRPAERFRPAFETVAEAGGARARLWLYDSGNLPREERVAILEELVRKHPDAPWMERTASGLAWSTRSLGADAVERVAREWLERAGDEERRDQLRFSLAMAIAEDEGRTGEAVEWIELTGDEERRDRLRISLAMAIAEDEGRTGEAIELLEVVAAGESSLADRARGKIFRVTKLREGMVAPDFEAETVGGESFRLSDFRGKVTVVEFWGFW